MVRLIKTYHEFTETYLDHEEYEHSITIILKMDYENNEATISPKDGGVYSFKGEFRSMNEWYAVTKAINRATIFAQEELENNKQPS